MVAVALSALSFALWLAQRMWRTYVAIDQLPDLAPEIDAQQRWDGLEVFS